MTSSLIAVIESLHSVLALKMLAPALCLAALWTIETVHPFFPWKEHRLRHASRNLGMALLNTVALSIVFGAATVYVADWTTRHSYGLLNAIGIAVAWKFVAALLLLDAWMYCWHRANHVIPILWRFHRTHHSDARMDVTTATRFHLGEQVFSSALRLMLIPALGFGIWHIVVYDMMVVLFTQFHHANISLGRYDRWIRLLIVTPDMHKVHHSRLRRETDSNYSVILSVWDRLAASFRTRPKPSEIEIGLDEFDDDRWQTLAGMYKTPFRWPDQNR